MLYTRIRFLLILLFWALGIFFHYYDGFRSAWYLYAGGFVLLLTHFLFGNVWAAFAKLRRGKLLDAQHLINQIKRPEWLAKQHRAYYHFIKGMLALQEKELESSESDLKEALQRGLRNGNDNALVALNLAHICYLQQRHEDARLNLQTAKSHQPNDLLIKEKISELEKVLAQPYN